MCLKCIEHVFIRTMSELKRNNTELKGIHGSTVSLQNALNLPMFLLSGIVHFHLFNNLYSRIFY